MLANKARKKLLKSDDLIEHMAQRGISFEEMSKDEARVFLLENNNYFKCFIVKSN